MGSWLIRVDDGANVAFASDDLTKKAGSWGRVYSLQACRWCQAGGKRFACWKVRFLIRGSFTGCMDGKQILLWSNGEQGVLPQEEITPCSQASWGPTKLKTALQQKTWWSWWSTISAWVSSLSLNKGQIVSVKMWPESTGRPFFLSIQHVGLFSKVTSGKIRGNGFKILGKNYLLKGLSSIGNSLHREVVESPSLEVFKGHVH